MQVWIYTLLSVFLVSLLSLIGVVTLALGKGMLKKILFFLVSFAVGGLFGDAFIHLLPESFKTFGFGIRAPLYVLLGILIFFILEKFIRWRHCHNADCSGHTQPMVFTNLIGDAAHNFIDGLLIGASYIVDLKIGIATTLAIILHEIPHELGNFGIFVQGGLSIKKALGLNFLSALVSVLGGVVALTIGHKVTGFSEALLPITAGGFIYVAGSDLIPELQHDTSAATSLWQLACIVLGLGMMAILAIAG